MNIDQLQLEREVMEMLLEGDDPNLEILRHQFRDCRIASRRFTGVGFFTYFALPHETSRLSNGKNVFFGDVVAEIPGLSCGAGFVLHVQEGAIDFLEGYTFDEPWPDELTGFSLRYMGERGRDLASICEKLR